MKLDRYARDAQAWTNSARVAYTASAHLFTSENFMLVFPAATLGHHALEMFLKAALIANGAIVVDPKKLRCLDGSESLEASDCVWGHRLIELASQLARRQPNFDLKEMLAYRQPVAQRQLTLEQGFAVFDPFFTELRYPRELTKVEEIGAEERVLLDELVQHIQPFLKQSTV